MRILFAVVLLATTPLALAAETVVPVHEEPRHRLVHEGPELRVLDVEIVPGDTTLFHRHDAPIAYVYISPAPTKAQVLGEEWGGASPNTSPAPAVGSILFNETYATAPVEHRVTNPGEVPFRLIAILNRGPGQADGTEEFLDEKYPVETSGRWFRSSRRTLASQETWAWESHRRPVVVVQVSSGSVVVEPGTGSSSTLQSAGDFIVLRPENPARFRNAGGEPATLAIVEVR